MDFYIGFDVSLASTAICVLSVCGKVVKEANAASEPEALTAFLQDLAGNVEAEGLEAGPLSQWLHMHLTAAGFEVVLMEARHVKSALKAMPVKTDRRDAFGILSVVIKNGTSERLEHWRLWFGCVIDYAACFWCCKRRCRIVNFLIFSLSLRMALSLPK
ncbi:transposase (plasmid) [Leisingera sp. M527]|uniref:IS110 family transposase n=1 Tax=Leisingera sp. M527 TaxID=2867014 RepID=UPI0021FAE24C|nr:transposase [Leisingera sp. M527]UWQ35486.1 transposase [Leisingera sp. M527]